MKDPKPRGLWLHARFLTWLLRIPLRTLAFWHVFNTTIINRERIPKKGAAIFAGNHPTEVDPFYHWGMFRRVVIMVAKAELWKLPVANVVLWLQGHIPVKRGDEESRIRSMDAGKRALRHGACVMIYPEGGCSNPDGTMREQLKSGIYHMAAENDTPVYPVFTRGTRGVLSQGSRKLNRKHPVTIIIGEPIRVSQYPEKDPFLRELRRRILELDELYPEVSAGEAA